MCNSSRTDIPMAGRDVVSDSEESIVLKPFACFSDIIPGNKIREEGKPSPIEDHCESMIREHGDRAHIWICMKRGRSVIARDIVFPEDEALGVAQLRRYCGWFKHYISLYSVTAVQEVKIRFLGVSKAGEVEVVVKPFDYVRLEAKSDEYRKDYNEHLKDEYQEDGSPTECTVSVMGTRHGGEYHVECAHAGLDPIAYEPYCLIQSCASASVAAKDMTWMPQMVQYFWQNGIGKKGKEYLQTTRFLHSYRSLMFDKFQDAESPYGKTINAFLLVEGWHLKFLLWVLLGCLLLSVCIVAVTTAASHSLDAGLSAGSYALGFGGVAVAVLTFLSAVL